MKKNIISGSLIIVATLLASRTIWELSSHKMTANSETLWKEYPPHHLHAKRGTVKIKVYENAELCRYALQGEVMASRNVGNGIRYYCM